MSRIMIRFQEGAVSSQTSCVAEINFGRTAIVFPKVNDKDIIRYLSYNGI